MQPLKYTQQAINGQDVSKVLPDRKSQDRTSPKTEDEVGKTQDGQKTQAADKTCTSGCPISLVTGEELLVLEDFKITGPMPLSWLRTYRSSNAHNLGLGYGWTHSFSTHLKDNEQAIDYYDAEGRVIPFKKPAIGQYIINRAERFKLQRLANNHYRLESTDAAQTLYYEFQTDETSPAGTIYPLQRIKDKAGNHLFLIYDQQRLIRLEQGNESWSLDYNDQGLICRIKKHSSLQIEAAEQSLTCVSYDYNQQQDLIQAKDPEGNSERYLYQNHLLIKRTLKSGYSFHFQWDGTTSSARCLRNWGDDIAGIATYNYQFNWQPARRQVEVIDSP